MNIKSKIIMSLAGIVLIGVFLFPIWKIDLNAPQYPEGIGLKIQINTIEGKKKQDLKNINGLNHYIGMKSIEPDSIPELKIMPPVMIGLMVTAVFIALFGSRKWILIWIGAFTILGIAGLVDYYLWGYDYGHNLNPDAPIKIPGMVYQPPFIGTKQLLNMETTSLPDIGFWFAMLGMVLAGWAYTAEGKLKIKPGKKEKTATGVEHKRNAAFASAFVTILILAGCSQEPQTVHIHQDDCSHCRMIISDMRFATQLVTDKGKAYKFDSVECMIQFSNENKKITGNAKMWVSIYNRPGTWIGIDDAFLVEAESVKSPMGMNWFAVSEENIAERYVKEHTGKLLDWNLLLEKSERMK